MTESRLHTILAWAWSGASLIPIFRIIEPSNYTIGALICLAISVMHHIAARRL